MKIDIGYQLNTPKLKAWCLYGVGRDSNICARCLDESTGNLVGFSGGATGKKLEKEVLTTPNLKQIIALGKNYIPKMFQKEFEEKIKKLYKK